MSELIVVGFKDIEEADRVLLRLSKLKKEYLIDLDDAVVVVRDETGKVHLKQSIDLVATSATSGFVDAQSLATRSISRKPDRSRPEGEPCPRSLADWDVRHAPCNERAFRLAAGLHRQ